MAFDKPESGEKAPESGAASDSRRLLGAEANTGFAELAQREKQARQDLKGANSSPDEVSKAFGQVDLADGHTALARLDVPSGAGDRSGSHGDQSAGGATRDSTTTTDKDGNTITVSSDGKEKLTTNKQHTQWTFEHKETGKVDVVRKDQSGHLVEDQTFAKSYVDGQGRFYEPGMKVHIDHTTGVRETIYGSTGRTTEYTKDYTEGATHYKKGTIVSEYATGKVAREIDTPDGKGGHTVEKLYRSGKRVTTKPDGTTIDDDGHGHVVTHPAHRSK